MAKSKTAKVPVPVRLLPETLEWLDSYAKGRGVSRQAVLEAAVVSFREDSERGVPGLEPAREPSKVPPGSAVRKPTSTPVERAARRQELATEAFRASMLMRQQRANRLRE